MQSSFNHRFVLFRTKIMCWKHVWHTNKCVDKWNMNLWMNECHINFASCNKFVFQMCFQCTILVCETYKLWLNKICMISIINHEMLNLWWMCIRTKTYKAKLRTAFTSSYLVLLKEFGTIYQWKWSLLLLPLHNFNI
jgi:hypothetical protein